MKRTLALATAIVTIGCFPAPTLAQNPEATQAPNAESSVADPDSTLSGSNSPDMDSFVAALERGSENAAGLRRMTAVSTFNVVRTAKWSRDHKQAYDAAMAQNATPIGDLQAAINGNDAIRAALSEGNIPAGDIVAAEINNDGSLTVYVR